MSSIKVRTARVKAELQDQEDLDELLHLAVKGRGQGPKTIESFAPLFFDSRLKQSAFMDIVETVRREGEITLGQLYARFQRSRQNPSGRYSASTISKVWVALIKSGILERKAKGQPAGFSTRFTIQLRRMAESWDYLVKDYVSHPPPTIAPQAINE